MAKLREALELPLLDHVEQIDTYPDGETELSRHLCPFEADCWGEQAALVENVVVALQVERAELREGLLALTLSFRSLWCNYDAYSQFVRTVRDIPPVAQIWTTIQNDTIHITTFTFHRDLAAREQIYEAEMDFMEFCEECDFDFAVEPYSSESEDALRSEGWQCLYYRPVRRAD